MANEFKVKKGLIIDGSNTVLDIQGTAGQLFSVTDSLTGDLFSVSDVSGVPIFNVNSSGTSTFDGDVNIAEKLIHNGDTNTYLQFPGTNDKIVFATNGSDVLTLDAANTATFAGNVILGDDKNLDFGAATDFRIVHNSTTNVNHISSKLDRQLSLNANNILLTNQANDSTFLHLSSTGATFIGDINTSGELTINNAVNNNNLGIHIKNDNNLYSGALTFWTEYSGTDTHTARVQAGTDGTDAALYLQVANTSKTLTSVLTLDHDLIATFAGVINANGGINVTGNIDTPELSINDYIKHNGDTNTYFGFSGADTYTLVTGGTTALTVSSAQDATFEGVVKTNNYFQVNSTTSLLKKYVPGWNTGAQTHDVIYNGWKANTGDYTYVKSAGNSTSGHGIIVAADLGTYLGTTDLETGAITDSATAPLDNTWAYFRNATAYIKGDTTFGGDITATGGDSHSFLTGNTSNLSTADTTGFRLHQTSYTDGKYTHRFRKKDEMGGVPLYLDFSSGTANVFANLMRFGKYSGEDIDVEVNGKLKATHFHGDGANLTNVTATASSGAAKLTDGGNASTHPGASCLLYTGQTSAGTDVLGMPTLNNANAIITMNKHSGEYNSQLGFSSNGKIYYRNFNNAQINSTTAWTQLAFIADCNNKLPLAGGTMQGHLVMGNYNISGVNAIQFNDPGPNEGVTWTNTKIFESPNDLTTNTSGNLQFVYSGTRRLTVDSSGIDVNGRVIASVPSNGVALELHQTQGSANDYVDLKMIAGNTNAGTLGTILRHKRDGTGGGDFSIFTNPTLTGTPTEKFKITSTGETTITGGTVSSGNAVLDVQGTAGQLFSVTNSLTGDLFSVSDVSGVPIFNVNSSGVSTFDGDVQLADNDKIQLGNSQDLQIYHDGSNSYINETGTGVLSIQSNGTEVQINNGASEYMGRFITDAGVKLYYNNSLKFETTNTGISVAGDIILGTDLYAKKIYRSTATISSSSYTTVATVAGDNLGSAIRMVVTGTSGNVVMTNIAEILVNHSTDILIKTTNSFYRKLYIKIVSDGNEDFAIELKRDGDTNNTTVQIEIEPLGNETVTFTNTHGHTNSTLEHISQYGETTSQNDTAGNKYHKNMLDNQKLKFGDAGTDLQIYHDGSNSYIKDGNASSDLIIQSNHILLQAPSGENMIFCNEDAEVKLYYNNSAKFETLNTGVEVSGTMTATGDVIAFSDERLKTNVKTLDGSKVYEMRGVSFNKDDKKGSGVIAQELEKVAPELVNNDSEYKAVAYGNITGYLIEAIKDLKQEITELKKQINNG